MYYKVVQRKHRAQERAPPLFGGVKVIGNFAEHAPKQRPFGGILPLQGSFLSISWLVLAAIFSFVGFFALQELVLRVLLVVWLLFCQF